MTYWKYIGWRQTFFTEDKNCAIVIGRYGNSFIRIGSKITAFKLPSTWALIYFGEWT